MAKESLGERVWYKYWPHQVPKCLDYPDCTLAEFLKEAASKHGPKPAIYLPGRKGDLLPALGNGAAAGHGTVEAGPQEGGCVRPHAPQLDPVRDLLLCLPAPGCHGHGHQPHLQGARDPAPAQGFRRQGAHRPGCGLSQRPGRGSRAHG